MLKIGVIGLGSIAQKAYLPVLTKKELEVHLFTRDQIKLRDIGAKYRFKNLHDSLDSMISAGIQAAFVHTATDSHEDIVAKLLNSNIHVFVDTEHEIVCDFLTCKLTDGDELKVYKELIL